ncbi:hypothetical protein HHI36_013527 [Cryptolaemus montrouzieri]|uniref:Uncharacterized protein n=1 Tax=Cryptolaemus montrouzieri TaxID=559131 RepID=A0ABD2NHR4_9CUCU
MGLPQLPTFQKEEENSSIMKGDIKTFSEKKSIDEVKNKVKVDKDTSHQSSIDEIGRNDIVAVKSFENCTLDQQNDRIQVLNTMREIDPMALVLAENRMNNAELRQHLSLLTLKLNEMTNSTKNEDKTNDKLKSQLRAYQLKTENLESELKLYQKNYDKLHKITIDLSSKLEESNSNKGKQMKELSIDCCVQTDLFASEIELKAHFIQLLDLINRLSLNPVKVDLKELKI